jgi:hypothetical protein
MIKWLLRDNPSLLGDVLEERASGRSRGWYWRQVLIAVVRSMGRIARAHPVLMLRAIGMAIIGWLLVGLAVKFGEGYVYGYFFPFDPMPLLISVLLIIIPATATGWAVARTHRACAEAAIVAIILLSTLVSVSINWVWPVNIFCFLAGALLQIRQHARSAIEGSPASR